MTEILVATNNKGKLLEFEEMLQDLGIKWLSLTAVGITNDVEETGTTFLENATLKATAYARQAKVLTLADDSGLEVDALNGRPGVYTARFGGPNLSYEERYQLLLQRMKGIPHQKRTARFQCVIVIAAPDGRVLGNSHGTCAGYIAEEPAGKYGFGYDPVFYIPQLGKTMAQLPSHQKKRISHRGKALRQVEPRLRALLQEQV